MHVNHVVSNSSLKPILQKASFSYTTGAQVYYNHKSCDVCVNHNIA